MTILAIDTALGATAACLWQPGDSDLLAAESLDMERGHAEALLPMLERVLKAGGGLARVERVAVTIGPGSFTGIRVGIAAARAIGLARKIPVVGVSTLSAIAAPLIAEREPGLIAAAIDARHGNVYVQGFAAGGRTLFSPRLAAAKDAVRALGAGPFRVAGSGGPALAIEAWTMGLSADVVGSIISPDIYYVARLGALADPETSAPRPLYLKAPDAKMQENGKISRAS